MKRLEKKKGKREKEHLLDIIWVSGRIIMNTKIRTLEMSTLVFLIGYLL